jgi:hypothetical protein
MSVKQNDLPCDDRKEENSSLKTKDIIAPAAMLVALSGCGGSSGSGSSAGGTTTGTDTSSGLPPPADGRSPSTCDSDRGSPAAQAESKRTGCFRMERRMLFRA